VHSGRLTTAHNGHWATFRAFENDPFETPNHGSPAWLGGQFEINRDGTLEPIGNLPPAEFELMYYQQLEESSSAA
jgi:hypothetical protein